MTGYTGSGSPFPSPEPPIDDGSDEDLPLQGPDNAHQALAEAGDQSVVTLPVQASPLFLQLFDSFAGMDVAPFTDEPSGAEETNPFDPPQRPGLDSSLASNGPIPNNDASSAVTASAPGTIQVPATTLQGLRQIDTVAIGGTNYAHFQGTIDGVAYDFFANDKVLPGQAIAVPMPAAASAPLQATPAAPPAPAPQPPAAALPPQANGTLGPTAPSPGPLPPAPPVVPASSPPPPSSWLGDFLGTIAGLFSPSSVGPYLHPQTPANLPAGLQQMAQLNAAMAQQSLQNASARTRAGIVGAGTPYALTLGALTAPAVGALGYEGSIAFAARFPGTTAALTGLGNALTGTTVPRLAIGTGTAAIATGVGTQALSEIEANPALPQEAAEALAPELSSSLSASAPPASGGAPLIVDTNVLAQAADKGNPNALAAVRSGQPYVTLSQLREFLDVTTETQQTQRAQFLLDEGVVPLPTQYGQLTNPQIASTFWQIANQQGKGDTTADAALVVQGIQSGYTIVTGDGRLINTVEQTLQIPGVTFQRVQF